MKTALAADQTSLLFLSPVHYRMRWGDSTNLRRNILLMVNFLRVKYHLKLFLKTTNNKNIPALPIAENKCLD